ncbi:WD repeat-containing protein 76-like [Dysidea avara]|uniref:WD repeat-containing protein 76-like n=1 Tax=Dysidea avara TaxID=196820 RepID=UPI00331E171D
MPKTLTTRSAKKGFNHSSSNKEVDLVAENQPLSEYELKRLKRIEENKAVLKSLNIIQAKEELNQLQKRKTTTTSRQVKSKVVNPLPSRRSARLQERLSSYVEIPDNSFSHHYSAPLGYADEHPSKPDGPIDIVCVSEVEPENETAFKTTFLSALKSPISISAEMRKEFSEDVDLSNLEINQIEKVTKDRIFSLAVAPATEKTFVLAGDKWGKIGIWDTEGDDIHLYEPHSRPVSAIVFNQEESLTKFYSSSYDGTLRACDLEKGVFDQLIRLDYAMTACSVRGRSLLVGLEDGSMITVDCRQQVSSNQTWKNIAHKSIKCVSVNPVNDNYFAVSSSDRSVGIWDIRNIRTTGTPRALVQKINTFPRTVTSAKYSPISGNKLLTTSLDNQIRVYRSDTPGGQLAVEHQFYHNNHVGRWLTNFRAEWDPKCDFRFVCGSMSTPRQIDLFSICGNVRSMYSVVDEAQTSVCSLVKYHPTQHVLFGANSSGKVFIWK